MNPLKTLATAISIAIVLSCAAFPGGAMLCREESGGSRLEPFHAPHAHVCLPAGGPSDAPDAACGAHDHELCTDTEATGFQAPVKIVKLRPAAAGVPRAGLRTDERPAAARAAFPGTAAPLLASHIPTTILRT